MNSSHKNSKSEFGKQQNNENDTNNDSNNDSMKVGMTIASTDIYEDTSTLKSGGNANIKRKIRGSPAPPRTVHSFPRSKEDEKNSLLQQFVNMNMINNYYPPVSSLPSSSHFTPPSQLCFCPHNETEIVNGVIECIDCGQKLEDIMDQEQEWRYYGDHDNKNTSDPSRCQFRKSPDKGIRKDLEKLNLPTKVINLADQYYFEVTKGEIKRGNLRKGIMFACVFEAYKDINKHQIPDQLRTLFGIDKKNGSRGLTYFLSRKKKTDREYITAEHFIPKICEKFQFTDESILEVRSLYHQLKLKSPQLDHSYPQSVACGCVYYVLTELKRIDITGEQFGKIVGLSSMTIMKKSNEIKEILHAL